MILRLEEKHIPREEENVILCIELRQLVDLKFNTILDVIDF